MRTKVLVLLTCLLFSALALAQGKAETKSKPAGKAAAGNTTVPDKAVLQKLADSWSQLDTDALTRYYDQSASDVFYDVAPLKYDGFSQYVAGAKEMLSSLKSLKFSVNDDATVHRSGNLAWTTATVKMTTTDKADKSTNLDCRWTTVWEKKGPNWLIVHEHFSAPAEPPK
jgi:ketosteroid isomerase-like protein